LPIRQLRTNTETDSRVKWLLEKFSQFVRRGVQQASGRQYYSVQAKWCLRVSVYCVSRTTYQPQPQQKPQLLVS